MYVQEAGLEWSWSAEKDELNRRKHGLPLSVAEVALVDPLALSKPDPHPDGDRWDTLAAVHGKTLFIVHTWPEDGSTGRVIGVREATCTKGRPMRMVRKLTAEEKAALSALKGTPDLTDPDAPEVASWDSAVRGVLYRPVKRPVTMRLDADVLEWFRSRHAKGYQTRINAILREYIERHR
jgi:uncharacterized protein